MSIRLVFETFVRVMLDTAIQITFTYLFQNIEEDTKDL